MDAVMLEAFQDETVVGSPSICVDGAFISSDVPRDNRINSAFEQSKTGEQKTRPPRLSKPITALILPAHLPRYPRTRRGQRSDVSTPQNQNRPKLSL